MKAVLSVLLLAVVSQTTVSAQSELCLSGDNQILSLFVDGQNWTPKLRHKSKLRNCDCVDLPLDTGLIAIEAKNWRGPSGIQACISGNPTNLKGWVCEPIRRFKRKWAGWTGLSYDDRRWRKAKRRKCLSFQRCYEARARTIPCNPAKNKCFWSQKPGKRIRCRLNQCAERCSGCKSAGIGQCDSDKCLFGSATVVATGKPTCNRKCCLVVKTNSDPAAEKYMQLTDGLTGHVDTYSMQTAGRYFAMVDIDTCTFFKKEYRTDSLQGEIDTLINNYKPSSIGAAYANTIGIDADHSPYLVIWELGIDKTSGTYRGSKTEFRACINGVKNGAKIFTGAVLT